MVDVISNKIKAIQFKGFYLIKNFSGASYENDYSRLGISQARSGRVIPKSVLSRVGHGVMSSTNLF
jgi:hypothetical protein